MNKPLTEYRRKRNFKSTVEPRGGGRRGGNQHIFVVQLHHASRRHYDFRLEWNGVLRSWAVPKGPSLDPGVKRLAMEVEDHPISYAGFAGDIPEGNYGAGHVDIFDQGTWEPEGNADDGFARGDLKFRLHGDVLRGSWVLVRTRRVGSRQQWLLIKHGDEYAAKREADDFLDAHTGKPPGKTRQQRPSPAAARSSAREKTIAATKVGTREALNGEAFAPELCRSLAFPPTGDDWLHEVKWDGYRMLATVAKGKVRLWSRNAIEWTHKLPELVRAIAALKLTSAQLDGELVVLRRGRDDFNALQGRLAAENRAPALLMLFDLPHLNGRSLRAVPLIERKRRLDQLLEQHPHPLLRFSAHEIGNGKRIFAAAVRAGREGIVSKRIDSVYAGNRNGDWVKVKGRASDEFVVIGFTEPKGGRSGLGALLLARAANGKLVYAGRVGTGFAAAQLRTLRKHLDQLVVARTPADVDALAAKDRSAAIWVRPRLIAEVYHQGIGGKGLLRQPAFKVIREDKDMSELQRDGKRKRRSSAHEAADETQARITHPERIVFRKLGLSKGDVAAYYTAIAERMLPELANRPLSLLRCPDGVGKECFFQKHITQNIGAHVQRVRIRETSATGTYFSVNDAAGMLELVQMNTLEFHPWGTHTDDIEHCDRLVFDLDPDPRLDWKRMLAAARDVRAHLEKTGLQCFVRTSGGKGLHVVVPLNPAAPWDIAREFSSAFARTMSELKPANYVATAGEKNRRGRIFIDWLRNGRGATSVASYSLRARPEGGIAMPLSWAQLGHVTSGHMFTIPRVLKLVARQQDPWQEIAGIRQKLPKP